MNLNKAKKAHAMMTNNDFFLDVIATALTGLASLILTTTESILSVAV